MAMLIDALVERGMKVAEREKREEERAKQKATMHQIQEHALTATKMKKSYQEEQQYKKKVLEESVKQHRFKRQKQNREKSLKRRKYDGMKLEILQEFEDNNDNSDSEDSGKDNIGGNDCNTVETKIEKQLNILVEWEKSISDEFNVLKHGIVEKWKDFGSSGIPSLTILNHIYGIFVNKLLVNEYSRRFPTQIVKEYTHRYIKCISLQIVLRQIKSKISHPIQKMGNNRDTYKSYDKLLTIHNNYNKSFLSIPSEQVQDTNELVGYVDNSTSDEDAVVECDANHEYHFVCESSDSDLDNLEEVHKELHKYALSTKDINLDIKI